MLCWCVFPLAPALRSTDTAATAPADASAGGFLRFVRQLHLAGHPQARLRVFHFTPLSGSPKKISIASPTNLSIVPPSLSAILDLDESTFKVHKRPSCVVPSREVRRWEKPTGSHNLICKQGGPQFAALLPCCVLYALLQDGGRL